jgi:uncharacterized membrane protein
MESRVKVLGHPVHPMLIVFPLGLLIMAVIFDIVFFITRSATFAQVAFFDIAAGVIGGLLAALFGFTDWLGIPAGTRAKTVGAVHGLGNVGVVLLFAISWFVRKGAVNHEPSTLAFLLAILGVALGGFTAWLGGELVYRLRVAVDDDAGLDASNSITGEGSRKEARQG